MSLLAESPSPRKAADGRRGPGPDAMGGGSGSFESGSGVEPPFRFMVLLSDSFLSFLIYQKLPSITCSALN